MKSMYEDSRKLLKPLLNKLSIGSKLGNIFKFIMLIILPIVAGFVLNKRTLLKYRLPYTSFKTDAIVVIIALFIGVYDGFYGPGAGTFLMLLLVGVAHVTMHEAVGTTKVINLSTNFASLMVFLVHDVVVFPLAIVAAFFGIAGNYIGANHFAKKGVGYVKPLTIFVLAIFFLKLCCELFLSK